MGDWDHLHFIGNKEYQSLETDIRKTQVELKKRNPTHPFLKLVRIDAIGIHHTEEFGGRYKGLTVAEGLRTYIKDLETEIKNYK